MPSPMEEVDLENRLAEGSLKRQKRKGYMVKEKNNKSCAGIPGEVHHWVEEKGGVRESWKVANYDAAQTLGREGEFDLGTQGAVQRCEE